MSGTDNPLDDPDLRRRIGWTLGALAVFRVGTAVPIPGVDAAALQAFFDARAGSLLGFLNAFTGGALGKFSLLSLGVLPFISASVLVGRRGSAGAARLLTLVLALLQALGLTWAVAGATAPGGAPIVADPGPLFVGTAVLTLTAGAIFAMWLGEQISEVGIGSGVPLLVFAGLAGRIPSSAGKFFGLMLREEVGLFTGLAILAALLAAVAAAAWVETAQRKISVQYAQRIVGRRMYAGSQGALPLKVDQSGLAAVIFAASLFSLPLALAPLAASTSWGERALSAIPGGGWAFDFVFAALIVFLGCFVRSAAADPSELAENLKKAGGSMQGVRSGEPTAARLAWTMKRLALAGALFAAGFAVLPDAVSRVLSIPFFFDGAALLIVVGVAIDAMSQVETRVMMRRYESALKKRR